MSDGSTTGILFDPRQNAAQIPSGQVADVTARLVTVKCFDDTFWRGNGLTVPYVSDRICFRTAIRSVMGDDIPNDAIEQLRQDLVNGSFQAPTYEFHDDLPRGTFGFYHNGTIGLSELLIKEARTEPTGRWLLLLVALEEFGHHLDHRLRTHYSSVGGDAPGDEGTFFAADFVHHGDLLDTDFDYGKFTFRRYTPSGPQDEDVVFSIKSTEIDRETRMKYLLRVDDPEDDKGTITLKDGTQIQAEFFAIRGAGAVHEDITKAAAKDVGLPWDYRLDEGCAWPDVPCANPDSVETCYVKTWLNMEKEGTLAFRSHHGDLQYWHSMCPTGGLNNRQVLDKIISQTKQWYEKATRDEANGLFHLGKLMHMLQDSFSRSHTWRVEREDPKTGAKIGQVLTFQDYNAQNSKRHATADKPASGEKWSDVPGADKAFEACKTMMKFYKEDAEAEKHVKKAKEGVGDLFGGSSPKSPKISFDLPDPFDRIEKYLREDVYSFAPGAAEKKAGGTHPDYAP